MNNKSKENIVFKIITLGNSGVGKTSIIERYINNIFNDNAISTVGLEFCVKKIKLKDGKEISLKLMDTSGQEKYSAVTKSYLKNAEGVLFVFALNNKESFDKLREWIQNFNDNSLNKDYIAKYIVGNKCDLKDISIKENEIKEFSDFNGMEYFITSAKENINIEKIFQEMGEILYDNYIKSGRGKNNQMKLVEKSNKKKKNECCYINGDID